MNLPRSSLVASLIAVASLSAFPVSSVRAADNLGAANALAGGNPVPGVCLLSREALFAQAKIGQAASQRLSQLAEQANSQLETQRKPLDADIQSFQQTSPSLSEAQRKQQGAALQQRMQAFQTQSGETNQRIQLTRAKAMQSISEEAQPIIASSYTSHHCGLLLNRDAVIAGNMANDLTGEVIQGLDRKITTLSFNLEPLPSGNGK